MHDINYIKFYINKYMQISIQKNNLNIEIVPWYHLYSSTIWIPSLRQTFNVEVKYVHEVPAFISM